MSKPIEQLSALHESDMAQVNAQIIQHMQSPVALIPQLAGYLIAAGGKRVRPLLTLASTQIFTQNSKEDMARAANLAACVEFIHTATLLHDDVVDESDQRRGQDAANLVFGNQASVLVGDFLFSRAFQLMTADGSLEILKILSDASAVIAEGEVLQLTTQGRLDTSMEDYIRVIESKTAALFSAACEVGPVIADADKPAQDALRAYGHNLGIAFQIADDVLDYSAAQEKLGKTIGDDFREGKITAPIIFALQHNDDREFWHRVLHERDQKDGDLQTALDIFHQTGALEQSIALAKDYADKAQKSLNTLPEHQITALLHDVLMDIVEREF